MITKPDIKFSKLCNECTHLKMHWTGKCSLKDETKVIRCSDLAFIRIGRIRLTTGIFVSAVS